MSRAPRVLVSGVVLGQPMGGVRRHNRELLPRLAYLLEAHGGSLSVLEGRERIDFDLPPSVERLSSRVPMHPVAMRAHAESRALRRALRMAEERGAPFEFVHTAHMPAPNGLDTPYTLTIHDLRSLSSPQASAARRLIARRVIQSAVRHATAVFTVSDTVARELLGEFDFDRSKLSVIHNGVDHFEPLPRAAQAGAPIVCVGHVEPRKNLELMVRAIALDAKLPPLAIHGAAKGDEEQRLRALAASLGCADRVRFHGAFADSELALIYSGAACVCLPSWVEGFGIVALEAQRAHVPLAVARGSALIEVAGQDAPSFGPDDPAGCARALHAALGSSAEVLQRAAVRANRFTWDAAARAWFDGLCAALELPK